MVLRCWTRAKDTLKSAHLKWLKGYLEASLALKGFSALVQQEGRESRAGVQNSSRPLQVRRSLSSHCMPPHPPSHDPQDEQDTTVVGGLPAGKHSPVSVSFRDFMCVLFFPKPRLNK